MATGHATVSVATTATALNAADPGGQTIYVYNAGAAAVEWGGAGVTYGAGIPLAAGSGQGFDLGPDEVLYAVCEAATVSCRVGKSNVG